MADNLNVTPGAGATVAADEVNGALYQRVKIAVGADGVASDLAPGQAAMAASLPVAIASNQSAVPVTDARLSAYAPVGAHSSGANIAAATVLTKPAGAGQIILQALGQNARFTLDGTPPTAALGFQLLAGNPPMLIAVPGAGIQVIQEAVTASLQYQWVS